MVTRAYDHSGKRYGRLLVLHRVHPTTQRAKLPHWACECDCGNLTVVRADKLTRGETRSCGCLRYELFGNVAERGERVPMAEVRGAVLKVLQRLEREPASPSDVARDMGMTRNAAWIAFGHLRQAGRIELHQVAGKRRVYRVVGADVAPVAPMRPAALPRRPRDASAALAGVLGYTAPAIAPLPTAHYLGDD